MKKAIPVILLGLLVVCTANAQVKISPMKVIYVRSGEQIPDFKKRFEISYPIVEDVRNAAVRRRIENSISYWNVFDTTLKDDWNEYTWLDSMYYEVTYNKNGILDIELLRQGSAAYPDGHSQHVVVNTRTGTRVRIPDAFKKIGDLLVKIDEAQKKEIADHIEELKQDDEQAAESFREMMEEGTYGDDKLDEFSVSDTGVTFIYDYGFPHAIQALQPEGKYFFSWDELAPFIRPRGVFGQFVKK